MNPGLSTVTPSHPLNPPTSFHPYLPPTPFTLSPPPTWITTPSFLLPDLSKLVLSSSSPIFHLQPCGQQRCIDHKWPNTLYLLWDPFSIALLSTPWALATENLFGSSNKAFSLLLAVTIVGLYLEYSSPSSSSSLTLLILQEALLAPSPIPMSS